MTAEAARPGGAGGLVLVSVVAAVALAILFGLGSWQLSRMAWKNELIQRVESRARLAPAPAPDPAAWPALNPQADEFRRIVAEGRFRHDREIYLYGVLARGASARRPDGAQGFFVVTPLERADGSVILVNRGFTPRERRDPATRAAAQTEGVVAVAGLLRFSEERGPFAAADDPARRQFFTRDIPAMARLAGVDPARVAPFTLEADDADPPGGYPIGGLARVTFPNRHFEYALTWYGLGLTLVGVYVVFIRQRLRRRSEPPRT